MKKQIKTSKLPLRTETLRTLTQKELTNIAGGAYTVQTMTNPNTQRCAFTTQV